MVAPAFQPTFSYQRKLHPMTMTGSGMTLMVPSHPISSGLTVRFPDLEVPKTDIVSNIYHSFLSGGTKKNRIDTDHERMRSVIENGFAVKDEHNMLVEQALHDADRMEYFQGMTATLLATAVEDGVDIKAYFPWSGCLTLPVSCNTDRIIEHGLHPSAGLLDNFEWADGDGTPKIRRSSSPRYEFSLFLPPPFLRFRPSKQKQKPTTDDSFVRTQFFRETIEADEPSHRRQRRPMNQVLNRIAGGAGAGAVNNLAGAALIGSIRA
ncbi:hypothetical protein EW146_g3713 [Bondarzewia mesenterica]|uniref:Uncharacterized protein n=1 Tax=Bondarzewia mesenterica TaxID=1095465 RepID=A0A4S4LWQ8_9AGAM|nr:hypothetical protein EW146_g3713 [Bondarzewia mesenterica]